MKQLGCSSAPLDLTVSDLERLSSRSIRFQSLMSRKGELGHMLLLNINNKPYMRRPMTQSHVTVTLKDESQCHSDCEALYLVKEPSYAIC